MSQKQGGDRAMKLSISRSSCPRYYRSRYQNSQPCEEAVFSNGEWWVDLNSLNDLIKLVDKCGEIIVREDNKLEIYDDRRE